MKFGISHIASLDQLLDKLHRRVILLAVLLFLGLHHHLLQGIVRRHQIDFQVILGPLFHKDRLLAVAQCGDAYVQEVIPHGNSKPTLIISHDAFVTAHEKNRSIGDRFMSNRIPHNPLHHSCLLCHNRNRQTYAQQAKSQRHIYLFCHKSLKNCTK